MKRTALRAILAVTALAIFGQLGLACGSSDDSPQPSPAFAPYRAYLEEDAETLVDRVKQLAFRVKAGNVLVAQSRYATSRVPYGHLELVAESLGGLGTQLEGGYDRIEKALWAEGTTPGAMGTTAEIGPTAEELLADVEELQQKVETIELRPATLATGSVKQLAQVSDVELAGDEEPRAEIDLVDAAANVEGVEAAFKAVRPLLLDNDRELVSLIEAQFDEVYLALNDFGVAARDPNQPRPTSPGTSFVLINERSGAEIEQLDRTIGELATLLAEVPPSIASE